MYVTSDGAIECQVAAAKGEVSLSRGLAGHHRGQPPFVDPFLSRLDAHPGLEALVARPKTESKRENEATCAQHSDLLRRALTSHFERKHFMCMCPVLGSIGTDRSSTVAHARRTNAVGQLRAYPSEL